MKRISVNPNVTSDVSDFGETLDDGNILNCFLVDRHFDRVRDLVPKSFLKILKELRTDTYTRKALEELDEEDLLHYIKVKTKNGVTLEDIIKSNITHPYSRFPMILDKQSFIQFSKFYGRVIYMGQLLDNEPCQKHYIENGTKNEIFVEAKNSDFSKIIKYCEVVLRRNVADFEMNTFLESKERAVLHTILISEIDKLFEGMDKIPIPQEWKDRLKVEKPQHDKISDVNIPALLFAAAYNVKSLNITAGAIVNFDDHVQFIASTKTGDILNLYNFLSRIVNCSSIEYLHSESCGYITENPMNLGSGFTAYIRIEIPFCKHLTDLKENYLSCCSLNYFSNFEEDTRDCITIYNERSYDIKEVKLISSMLNAISDIYKFEKLLEKSNTLEDMKMGLAPIEPTSKLLSIIAKYKHLSHAKKYFNFDKNSPDITTSFGGKLGHIIKINAYFKNCLFPRASDPDAYEIYSKSLTQMIRDYNDCRYINHPVSPNYGLHEDFSLELIHPKIKSFRVRYARNLDKFPFTILMTPKLRKEVEEIISKAFEEITTDGYDGCYYSFSDMSPSEFNGLLRNHVIENCKNPFKRILGTYSDWPKYRGIFVSNKCDEDTWIIAMVNDVDHLSVRGFDWTGKELDKVYHLTSTLMKNLDEYLSFSMKRHMGYLGSRPFEVGTGLRISALMRLPYLSKHYDELELLCKDCNLQVRGEYGAGSSTEGEMLDISVKTRVNVSEIESLRSFKRNITKVLESEGFGVTEKKSIYRR